MVQRYEFEREVNSFPRKFYFIKIAAILFCACFCFLGLTTKVHAAVYQYDVPITVTSSTAIASGTQSNFPMLVSSTLSQWIYPGAHIANLVTAPNGGQEPADLVFATSTANCGVNNLNFETESYSSSTGALVDWVNVPSLSAGTVIYACYDSPVVTSDQSHPSSTWNSNFSAVYHFATIGGTVNGNDSTGNANNLTLTNVVATSTAIGGGASFNGTSSVANTTGGSLNGWFTTTSTIIAWAKPTSASLATSSFFLDGKNSKPSPDWGIILGYQTNNWNAYGTTGYPSSSNPWASAILASATTFQQIVYGTDGATVYGYLNGVNKISPLGNITTATSSPSSFYIGASYSNGNYFGGLVDEVEVANTLLSPSWIATEYNNQSAPSSFYAVGSESSPATSYTLTGPSTAGVGVASTYTISPKNGFYSGTITPTSSAGGTISPASLTFSSSSVSQTFTYTPSAIGTTTISVTSSPALTNPSPITVTVTDSSIVPASLSFVSTGTSTISVASVAPSDGLPPYAYQWMRSTTSGGPYTNLSGAVGLTLADSGLTPGTDYYYVMKITDSFGEVATSSQIHVKTQPASLNTAVIVGVGDSITNGSSDQGSVSPLVYLQSDLSANSYFASVTIYNTGVGGSNTYAWQPGQANYNNALSEIQTTGANMVTLMLGTNDTKIGAFYSAPSYKVNMQNIINGFLAAGVQRVFVSYQPYINYPLQPTSWNATSDVYLQNYETEIDSLDNGLTVREMGNNPSLYTITAAAPTTYLVDGVHLTTAGEALFGNEWAEDIGNILNPGSSDAALSALTVAVGTLSPTFASSTTSYSVVLPQGTVSAPTVTATVDDPNATDTITQASSPTGSATILVTAQNGTTTSTYTISFTVAPTPLSITSFSVAATSTSLTVPITSFTASGTVVGYFLSESPTTPSSTNPSWAATATTTYTFQQAGSSRTLYAWVKDGSGNISSPASATVSFPYYAMPSGNSVQTLVASGIVTSTASSVTSTTAITFNDPVHISIGSVIVSIPSGTTFTTASSSDFTTIVATTSVSTANLPSNSGVLGTVQYGFASTSIALNQPVTITIPVDPSYNGQTLPVYQSEDGGVTWTQLTTCIITSGICSFTTSNLSSFAVIVPTVTTTPSTPGVVVAVGGGGSAYDIYIDNGVTTTATPSVTLSLYGTGAYTMEVSNSASFSSSTWIPYVTTLPWTLASNIGEQTVFVHYRAVSGSMVGSAQASIDLTAPSVQTIVSTTSTAGMSISQMQNLLASLEAELQTLRAAAGENQTPASSSVSFVFTRDLQLHDVSIDVWMLQKFLNSKGFLVSQTGFGSPGNETTIFGLKTWQALIEFQKSVGITPVSGYFGAITRKYIDNITP